MIYTAKYMNRLLLAALCLAPISLLADSRFLKYAEEYRNFVSISPEQPLFPFLMLFACLVGLGAFFKPKFGLLVILVFMMISTDLPVSRAGGEVERATTIRIEDIIILLVSGGWLLNRAKTRSLAIVKSVPINQPVIMMAVAMIISSLLGILQGTVALERAILFTLKRLQYFWIFFMALNIMDTKSEAKRALNLMLIFAALIAVIGTLQFFFFPASPLVGGGATATIGFGRANSLASFYLLVIGLMLGLLSSAPNGKTSYWHLIVIGITLVALLLTKSRGAYVAFIPLVLAAFFLSKDKRILLVALFLGLVWAGYQAFSIVKNPMASFLVERHYDDIGYQFGSIKDVAIKGPEADSSFNARYISWKNAMPRILEYPIFGHGVGAMKLGHLDNQYVHELYDTGLVGLICLLYLNLAIFMTVLKFYKNTADKFNKGVALGFLSGQAGILVHAITITNFYTILNMQAFCFLLALIMIPYYEEKRRASSQINQQTLAPDPYAPEPEKILSHFSN